MKVFVLMDGIPTVVLFTTPVSGSIQCSVVGVIHLSCSPHRMVQFAIPELTCSYCLLFAGYRFDHLPVEGERGHYLS